jgi:hypothetical protein
VVAIGLEQAGGRGQPLGEGLGRRVQPDSGRMRPRLGAGAADHVGGGIAAGGLARGEARAVRSAGADAVGPEVRQSSRSSSQASRYQRRPVKTSRCGSALRRLEVPSWSR